MREFLLLVFYFAFCVFIIPLANAENIIIKIGATLPLTGRVAEAGNDTKRGIELALKEFSTPEILMDAIFDDNQHDAKRALSSAKKLLNVNHADILISMWDMSDIVAPLAEQNKIPHLAIRWNPDITQKYKYTFTVESTYRSYVDSLLELLKKLSTHSVGILSEQGQGWILAKDYFKKNSNRLGITVLTDESYLPEENSYNAIVLRAIRKHPDFIILFSNPPHTENIIKRIRELSPEQKFTGYFENIDPSIINGVPFVAQFEVAKWFSKKFKDHFGEMPKSRAAQGYDILHLISFISKETGHKPDIESISSSLNKYISYSLQSASGPLIIKDPKVIESLCVWKIAINNIFQPYLN